MDSRLGPGPDLQHGGRAERLVYSRQRSWGVPIPIFYCKDCGETIINDATLSRVQELFRQHGSNIWLPRKRTSWCLKDSNAPAAAAGLYQRNGYYGCLV